MSTKIVAAAIHLRIFAPPRGWLPRYKSDFFLMIDDFL
jgi:hypothetical protein